MYSAWASTLSAAAFVDDPGPMCRSGQEAPSSIERIRGDKLDRNDMCLVCTLSGIRVKEIS